MASCTSPKICVFWWANDRVLMINFLNPIHRILFFYVYAEPCAFLWGQYYGHLMYKLVFSGVLVYLRASACIIAHYELFDSPSKKNIQKVCFNLPYIFPSSDKIIFLLPHGGYIARASWKLCSISGLHTPSASEDDKSLSSYNNISQTNKR